jgi:DAACS family dicarboxylate/amino acid:cation (Na+ or H+) symporter
MGAVAGPGHTRILAGLLLGAAVGVTVNYLSEGHPDAVKVVQAVVANVTKPIGDIFINLLFLAIIPLVFASLVVGVTKLGGAANVGRVGAKTLLYFLITTAIAAAIGLSAVNLIRPGDRLPAEQKDQLMAYYQKEAGEKLEKKPEFGVQTVVNIVPRNPLKAAVDKDMLAVIFTALLVGVALTRIDPEKSRLIIDVLEGVNQVTDFIIRLAMALAPYAVFALIFSTTALFGYQLLVALGAFVATVLLGLAVQLLVVFPVLVRVLGGMSPAEFFRKARGTMVTAFSTSSSSATLPTAIRCAEDELGVPPGVARFVLPLSASMNHNGTALFEGVTVVFLAQAFGVELTIPQQVLVLVLCVLTATGMAGVPGGSLPLIGLVLAAVGVQPGAIAIVLGVDRLLDMCRTMVNVTGDLTTAVYVGRGEQDGTPSASAVTEGEATPAAAQAKPQTS